MQSTLNGKVVSCFGPRISWDAELLKPTPATRAGLHWTTTDAKLKSVWIERERNRPGAGEGTAQRFRFDPCLGQILVRISLEL